MKQRLHLAIEGLVQGVSYRAYAATEARRLGLTGWVRNLRDGRVELLAEGPRASLEALGRWAEHGPPSARVEHVTPQWSEASGEFADFSIRETD